MATTPTTHDAFLDFLVHFGDLRLDMTSRSAAADLEDLIHAATTAGLPAIADRLAALRGTDYPTLTSGLRTLARDLYATLDH